MVLLNIWATWSVPCRAEVPSTKRLHEKYSEEPFKIGAVGIDGARDQGVVPVQCRNSPMPVSEAGDHPYRSHDDSNAKDPAATRGPSPT